MLPGASYLSTEVEIVNATIDYIQQLEHILWVYHQPRPSSQLISVASNKRNELEIYFTLFTLFVHFCSLTLSTHANGGDAADRTTLMCAGIEPAEAFLKQATLAGTAFCRGTLVTLLLRVDHAVVSIWGIVPRTLQLRQKNTIAFARAALARAQLVAFYFGIKIIFSLDV